ncbi:alpha/beta hydrolase [Psychroserpens sp. XS_ASV72]|uniref:alpha/beta hydrolase n=1 Tax=Psychroserpens sp. XS_ASV72 TaxID=3241293 RepID=UPI0035159CC3
MKKILVFMLLIYGHYGFGQSRIMESLSIDSKLLNKEINYSVYLPENYNSSEQTYPVLYLLHGFLGNETDWIRIGDLQTTVDKLITSEDIVPMVVIMPDGDDRLYMNKEDGSYPYEDMFITEFIPLIESKYRIKKNKKQRAICGLSMGGSGALRLAFKHHDIFGVSVAFSAGISTEEEIANEASETFEPYFGRISPSVIGKKGKDRLNSTIEDYDVLHWVKHTNANILKSIQIYFDCGDDDFVTVGNAQLHILLTQKGIPHEYRVKDGSHDWNYWKTALPDGIRFISKAIKD